MRRAAEGTGRARGVPGAGAWWSLPADAEEPDPAYRGLLAWIWSFSAQPRAPESPGGQRSLKVERMRLLLDRLGRPQLRFPSLLVAGTKGKGSTVAMLAACLRAAGHRVGQYTSPHLINWRERTCVDGAAVSTGEVLAAGEELRAAVASLPGELGRPTTFEVGTAFTLLHFARAGVRIAVLEAGVGGRLDATNVVDPLVSVITPISFDHTLTLGETLAAIAHHKAGILRPGRPAVVAPQPAEALAVVEAEARALGAPLALVGRDWRWRAARQPASAAPECGKQIAIHSRGPRRVSARVRVALLGDHQCDNATAAVAALHLLGRVRPDLGVPTAALRAGLARTEWPGRLQVLRREPWVVVDGAHNAASAAALRAAVEACFRARSVRLVLGLSAGKDARGVVEALAPMASEAYVTRSRHERAAEPGELAALVMPHRPAHVVPDLPAAIEAALARSAPRDLVLVTGSLFLVGEALLWARG